MPTGQPRQTKRSMKCLPWPPPLAVKQRRMPTMAIATPAIYERISIRLAARGTREIAAVMEKILHVFLLWQRARFELFSQAINVPPIHALALLSLGDSLTASGSAAATFSGRPQPV